MPTTRVSVDLLLQPERLNRLAQQQLVSDNAPGVDDLGEALFERAIKRKVERDQQPLGTCTK